METTPSPLAAPVTAPSDDSNIATATSVNDDTSTGINMISNDTILTPTTAPEVDDFAPEDTIEVFTPAAAATPSDSSPVVSPSSAGADMPSNEELLLREWTASDPTAAEAAAETSNSHMMPPVAPAIVLNETSEGSATSSAHRVYGYPVATFVSNFVRTSVNELRDHILTSPIYSVTAVPEDGEDAGIATATEPHLSMQSAPASMVTPVPAAAAQAPPTSSDRATSAAAAAAAAQKPRFMDESDDDGEAEYVLIDGDLVAIPAIHETYMDDYEYSVRGSGRQRSQRRRRRSRPNENNNNRAEQQEQQQQGEGQSQGGVSDSQELQQQRRQYPADGNEGDDDASEDFIRRNQMVHPDFTQSAPASCRPNHSRMHRGVRKVKKWMKRKNILPKRGAWHKYTPPSSQRTLESHQGFETVLTSSSHIESDAVVEDSLSMASISVASPPSTIVASHPDDESLSTEDNRKESPARKGKAKRKKNRLAWMRDIESNQRYTASVTRSQQQQMITSSTSPLSVPPAASADSSFLTIDSMPATEVPAVASLPAATEPLTLDPLPATLPYTTPSHRRTASNSSIASFTAEASASLLSPDHEVPSLNRQASIAAEYVGYLGTEDQLLQAGVLTDNVMAAEAYIEDRLDDYDKYDKKEDSYFPRSMVPRDADFKVDKQEAPCVDLMLRRAGEFAQDLGQDEDTAYAAVAPAPQSMRTAAKGKSDGESVPLSMATAKDNMVHNDILKLVMVGDARVDKTALARSLRQSSKKPRKKRTTLGVDVHSWTPPNDDHVRFTIWDVQGASVDASPYDANFGAHPGTQSLFFSDRSLYLLVWDLAASNRKTYRRTFSENDQDSDDEFDEDEEDENEYLREEANRQADQALQSDIEDRVLAWVDCIGRRGPHSAILPVAMVSGNMSPEEAKRRCDTMQTLMMEHTDRMENAPKVLSGAETVLCVSLDTNMGMDLLQETILAIATDASHSVFDHVGTAVPLGTTMVLETARRLKLDHKLVLVDHLLAELSLLKGETGMVLSVEEVMEALHFLSSIGEVLYFGGVDDVLSHYVILSRKWLVSALSCILRNDLKRELMETRRFMNMQCLYSDQQFPENPVTQAFSISTSNCPLLSSSDTKMLWQSMSFMREAADMSSHLQENPTTNSTMFGFLEHLLVHTGVFLPLDIDRFASPDVVYFVPSLLAQSNSRDVWTYKSSEAWMATLAHSWLFRDGAAEFLMEHVTVALLRDLYEFSHIVEAKPRSPPPRAQTFPFAQNSLSDFMDNHDGEAIGHIKIHQMMCWKNSLLIKIGCIFPEGSELRESFVEIFVTVADPSSPHCVAADAMRANMQRLIVSAKGQVGHHGRKLWRGGYKIVLDSIRASVAACTNVDLQVVCPECLAHQNSNSASTWSWDSVRAAAETGSAIVRCMRGHRVDSNLICGTVKAAGPKPDGLHSLAEVPKKPVKDLLPSVVLVALWDSKSNSVRNVGSGFIADKKQGLVVTAGHILFDMEEGQQFGTPYFGLKNAKVVIGLIPEDKSQNSDNRASFRYFAEIVADDIHSMDACVLKITTRFERDLDDESLVGEHPEEIVEFHDEHLPILKMTRRFELEESVRILGFNQAGEGLLEQGKHVNRSADFAKGYICKQFKLSDDHSESDSDDSSSSAGGFSPREEIVCVIPTIPGHSGGPCVNEEGRVVGILSRADPVDRQRCYLVPSSELKILLNKAKKTSSRVAGLKLSY
jgi:hypothetical protein